MVYSIQADLGYDSRNTRDQVFSRIQQEVTSKSRWGVDMLAATDNYEAGEITHPFAVQVDVRLTVEADMLTVRDVLLGYLTGPRRPRARSVFQIHNCREDEGHGECPPPTVTTF